MFKSNLPLLLKKEGNKREDQKKKDRKIQLINSLVKHYPRYHQKKKTEINERSKQPRKKKYRKIRSIVSCVKKTKIRIIVPRET